MIPDLLCHGWIENFTFYNPTKFHPLTLYLTRDILIKVTSMKTRSQSPNFQLQEQDVFEVCQVFSCSVLNTFLTFFKAMTWHSNPSENLSKGLVHFLHCFCTRTSLKLLHSDINYSITQVLTVIQKMASPL